MKYITTLLLSLISLTLLSQDTWVNIGVLTDNYPMETTWVLLGTNPSDESTIEVANGGPYNAPSTYYDEQVILNSEWGYEFIAYDTFGDGICCDWGEGLITLSNGCQDTIWSDPYTGGTSINHIFNLNTCEVIIGCTDEYATNYDPEAVINGNCEFPPCDGLVSFEVIQNPCQSAPQVTWVENPGGHCDVSQVMWAPDLNQLGENPYPINGATSFYIPYTIAFQTYYIQFKFGDPNGDNLSEIYEFTVDPCIQGCLDTLATNYNPFAVSPGPCDYSINECPEDQTLVNVILTLDQYPCETTWNITNQNNILLLEGGGYTCTTDDYITIEESICIANNDTIIFNLIDAYGDGMAGSLWGGSDGNALITLDCGMVQDTIFSLEQANFGSMVSSSPYTILGCEAFIIEGCTDPGFVEYNHMAVISSPQDCITPVVWGCVEDDAYNYCDTCNQQSIIPTCEYTLILTDGAGDGWFGSYLGLIQGNNIIGPFSLIEGFEHTYIVELSTDVHVDIIFSTIGNSISTSNQCGFTLIGPEGDVTLEGGTNIWNDAIQSFPYRYRGIPYCGNTCEPIILGCLDSAAVNFNEIYNTEDNSCYYQPGCTQAGYLEYYTQGFESDFDNGDCQTLAMFGCTNIEAFNYNADANVDNGGCIPVILGCINEFAFNFDINANTDDGGCIPFIYGCADPTQFNYDSEVNTDDGSCIPIINGCIDPLALNYNEDANTDNGSCIDVVMGCTDPNAYNYNSEANTESDNCLYDAGCVGEPGSPYWLNDGCYAWVIDVSPNCCNTSWNGGCQDLYNYCEINDETVGINDYGNNQITVFPNPSVDYLNIVSNLIVDVTLYDALGRVVIQKNNATQIDISSLEGGMYQMILTYDGNVFTKKIIKQ